MNSPEIKRRPAKCYLCGRQLYYSCDPRHLPEMILRYSSSLKERYVHFACLQFARKAIKRHNRRLF